MERTSYSKLSQRDVDRAETDLLINLSAITEPPRVSWRVFYL